MMRGRRAGALIAAACAVVALSGCTETLPAPFFPQRPGKTTTQTETATSTGSATTTTTGTVTTATESGQGTTTSAETTTTSEAVQETATTGTVTTTEAAEETTATSGGTTTTDTETTTSGPPETTTTDDSTTTTGGGNAVTGTETTTTTQEPATTTTETATVTPEPPASTTTTTTSEPTTKTVTTTTREAPKTTTSTKSTTTKATTTTTKATTTQEPPQTTTTETATRTPERPTTTTTTTTITQPEPTKTTTTQTATTTEAGQGTTGAVPQNIVPPEITGTAVRGAVLTASTGEWSGSPTSYSYQWLACEAGGPCVEIPEATGTTYTVPTYTPLTPEVGLTLRVLVTATGAGGSQTEVSEETATVKEAPPANIVPPQIAGATLKGAKLTASTGEWSGAPTSFAYQWESCGSLGTCTKIEGATSSTHTLTGADVGDAIRVLVTATGPGGSQTAISEETVTVTEPPPPPTLNLSLPKIAGTPIEGQKLTASKGEWSGAPTSFAYQWESCGSLGTCTKIEGATSSTHTLTGADVGDAIRVLVTATGPGGSQRAISEETATVTEPETVTEPSSTPTNCAKSLAACGFPDASSSNVGPGVACSSLTPSGGMTLSTAGTTISDENITGPVTINASNVTLTHDCITNNGGGEGGSAAVVVEAGGVGAQIDYSDVSGANTTSGSVEEAIRTNSSTAHTTADHDYLYNCGECFHGAGTLTNSYVIANAEINPGQSNEDHYEDIYDGGGGGPLVVNHNTMLNPHQQTAVVFASVDFGDQTTLTITDNLMAGGDYVLYGGGSGSGGSVIGPVTVTGNRFSRVYYELGGSLGIATYFDDSVTAWLGNMWDETLDPVPAP